MHLIHRNRVDHFADIPRNISPLRSPFPRGARLISVALIDKNEQDGHNHCLHRNGQPNEKDARRKPCPAGEGGPQRRDISREIREMIDAVAVDEVHHTDAPSRLTIIKNRSHPMTAPVFLLIYPRVRAFCRFGKVSAWLPTRWYFHPKPRR